MNNSGSDNRLRSDSDSVADETIQSEEFAAPVDQETAADNSRTMMIHESIDDSEQSSDSASQSSVGSAMTEDSEENYQTMISEDSLSWGGESDAPTLSAQQDYSDSQSSFSSPPTASETGSGAGSGMDSNAQTIMSDDDLGDGFDGDPDKTFQSDQMSDSGGGTSDASAQTFVSDGDVDVDVNQILSKTWGAGIYSGTTPGMTIKAHEPPSSFHMKGEGIPVRRLNDKADPHAKGEYELIKVLGEGGMGIVWDAKQRSVERNVAIKMIKSKIASKSKQTEKFIAEAIVTGDLEHPNIVPIHELGRDQDGNYFYAMKHVQGTPWNKVIKVMQLHENLDVLLRTCDAIAFAHARGIVHRDLKPENIMLGDFGEVLVMDWGLALPMPEFSKKDRITSAHGMGGTPAYMAPEMATGPINRVNYTSDVYLLGAILYEIVTGYPPHRGKTTQQCLAAAMRNVIAPSDHDDELVEIARRAMHSDTKMRYKTVKLFQGAIRNYLAHEKSLEVSHRATRELNQAKVTSDYTHFARSIFGFEEAIALWFDNDNATEGLLEARLLYAQTALQKGDFDLAESLIDSTDPDHEELAINVKKAKEERLARQRMLRFAKTTVGVLAATILLVVGVSYYLINQEVARAVAAEKDALEQKQEADDQRQIAHAERQKAEANSEIAIAERARAEEREREAKTQRSIAIQEKEKAILARQAEQYESYVARIGLAAAKVEENAFSDARELLLQCPPELRNWEWGRLMYLCSQSSHDYLSQAPVDDLALSPDGAQFATASWDGQVRLWNRGSGEVVRTFPHSSIYVHAVDWSPQGNLLATGSADTDGNLKIWDIATGKTLASVAAHTDAVIGLTFSDNGRWLVTCSYDNTAKLWDLQNPSQPQLMTTLVGHTWWVWDADFVTDFDPAGTANRLVTVGQDGKAIVWEITDRGRKAQPVIEFLEHNGPIYCVDYNPEGTHIATGGYDRVINYWNPDEIEPFNFTAVVSGEKRTKQRYQSLSGHIGPVRCVHFSRDGHLLISGAQDNAVKVWQMETGTSLTTFRGHDSAVRACAITPDGKHVLSGSEDQRAVEWSINDYAEFQTLAGQKLSGHGDAILSAYFSFDGEKVLTASRDRSARIWEASTGAEQTLLTEGHQFLSSAAVFMRDEQYLVTAAADNSVRLWKTATGSEVLQLKDTGRASLVSVSSDSKLLATGSDEESILVWDVDQLLSGNSPKPLRAMKGHNHPITAIAFVPNTTQLVSADTHGRCLLWETSTGQQQWSVRNHTMKISDLAFTDNGKTLLTASHDRTIGVYELSTGKELMDRVMSHQQPVIAISVSREGQRLVSITNRGGDQSEEMAENQPVATLSVWNLKQPGPPKLISFNGYHANDVVLNPTGTEAYLTCSDNVVRKLNLSSEEEEVVLNGQQHGGLLWSSLLSQDGRRLLTIGGIDARLWDLQTGSERMSFGPHGAVAASSMSPSGKMVVTGSWDHSLKFWEVDTGKTIRKISNAHQAYINTVTYSHNGKWIVSAGDDGVARLWDPQTGEEIRQFKGHEKSIHEAIFSPDDRYVLTASRDRSLRLWDRETGKQVGAPFVGHRWSVLSADFSPDGQRLISCSEDNKAILWNIATRQPIAELSGHTAAVTSVSFSPDGQRVLTASRDNTAKLWDVSPGHEGNEILTLKRHTQEVTSVDFSRDSLQVLTASRDGTAIIWPALDWRVIQGSQEAPPEHH